MANIISGVMRAVTKTDGAVRRLDRLFRVFNRRDGEFYLYRSDAFPPTEPPLTAAGGDLSYQDLFVSGAWSFAEWVFGGDHPETPLLAAGKAVSAHLTDLRTVCRALGVGVELRGSEPGCGFCELYAVTHEGEVSRSETAGFDPGDDEAGTEERSEIPLLDFSPVDVIFYGRNSIDSI